MYKACKTQQSAERQLHIQNCLIRLMLTHAYNDITVCALCEDAQIPRKAFYRYFESKDDILHAIANRLMDEYESYPGPYAKGDRRTSEKDIEKMFMFWGSQSELMTGLKRNRLVPVFMDLLFRRLAAEKLGFRLFQQADTALKTHITSIFTFYGLHVLIFDWYGQGCPHTPHEMACITTQMLTQPLFRRLE